MAVLAKRASLILCLGFFVVEHIARGATFGTGELFVERVGGDANNNGSGSAPTANGTAVFLDNFTLSGARKQTLSMPTAVSGSQLRLTSSGSAASEGYLSLSQNREYIVVPGYNAAIGAATSSSSPSTTTRVIGRVDISLNINTSTGFKDGPTTYFRSVVSTDGSNFHMSFAGVAGSASGLRYHSTYGSVLAGTNEILKASVQNVTIAGNRLFYSSSSTGGAGAGIVVVPLGGSPPTSSATGTRLLGTGSSGSGTPSPYGFGFLDDLSNANNFDSTGFDTMYVADDRTTANGGGIQKWTYSGTSWSLQYTITVPDTVTAPKQLGSFRGLSVGVDANGNPRLYATTVGTTSGTQGNALVYFTDLGNLAATMNSYHLVAESPNNTFYRGVVEVPEPSALAILGLLCGTILDRRARR